MKYLLHSLRQQKKESNFKQNTKSIERLLAEEEVSSVVLRVKCTLLQVYSQHAEGSLYITAYYVETSAMQQCLISQLRLVMCIKDQKGHPSNIGASPESSGCSLYSSHNDYQEIIPRPRGTCRPIRIFSAQGRTYEPTTCWAFKSPACET